MALNHNDQTRIRQFLLGRLSETEQQKLEERLMIEDDLFQELEISKSELVEEYCANELNHEDNQWFERNFLASPEGKERYARSSGPTSTAGASVTANNSGSLSAERG